MAIDKVVLAMQAALLSKYGDAGVARIEKALRALVSADRRRGHVRSRKRSIASPRPFSPTTSSCWEGRM
jgi:hypothetical protein